MASLHKEAQEIIIEQLDRAKHFSEFPQDYGKPDDKKRTIDQLNDVSERFKFKAKSLNRSLDVLRNHSDDNSGSTESDDPSDSLLPDLSDGDVPKWLTKFPKVGMDFELTHESVDNLIHSIHSSFRKVFSLGINSNDIDSPNHLAINSVHGNIHASSTPSIILGARTSAELKLISFLNALAIISFAPDDLKRFKSKREMEIFYWSTSIAIGTHYGITFTKFGMDFAYLQIESA